MKTSKKKGKTHQACPAQLALRGHGGSRLRHLPHGGHWHRVCAGPGRGQPKPMTSAKSSSPACARASRTRSTPRRSSSSIVEVVSAEDIGKLPDASIAESIGRLPGIAAQRTNGRAQTLSIRGLGPGLHRHDLQWPRTGLDQRQPHGRIRPVPVGAGQPGQGLQDARRRHGLPGHRGHHGYPRRSSRCPTPT